MQPAPIAPSKRLLDYIDFDLLAGSACCGVFGHIFGSIVSPITPLPVGFMTFSGANLLAGTLNRRNIAWHQYTTVLLHKNKQQLNNALVERFEQLSNKLRQSTLKLTEIQTKIENLEKDIKELNKKPMEKLDQLYRKQKEINESCKKNREEIAALRELLNQSTLVTNQPAPLNQLPTDIAQQKNK
ncbi:hypothetical protein [Salinisphaera sp. G21_0]|uniref:hypothetical protein n=1 Tax=Salinisphaera sp. G21_0 TaxID=2821094 RepID=UPI001ADD4768|nr:hypothetical protein [Salinisphaera sp. G21_0]MBO9482319.1 hypothetical protein [Salinisphaera sp. G21_0]